jgi:hypothetical protein
MFVNIINSYRYVVAISDNDLIGKKFEEGNAQLDVKENFYKGEEKNFEEVCDIIEDMRREDSTFNIIGPQAIKAALKTGLILENQIGNIEGIPFALVLI